MFNKEPKKIALCQLGKNIRLVVLNKVSYILQIKDGDVWKDKYHYGWIGDALKGYVLYALRQYGLIDSSSEMNQLMLAVEQLDTHIQNAHIQMTKEWRDYTRDPIEKAINTARTRHSDE